jgi:hypothetical protein
MGWDSVLPNLGVSGLMNADVYVPVLREPARITLSVTLEPEPHSIREDTFELHDPVSAVHMRQHFDDFTVDHR